MLNAQPRPPAGPGWPHLSKDTTNDALVPVENAPWLAPGARGAGAADRADVRSRPSSCASFGRYGTGISRGCIRWVKLTRSRPERTGRLRLPDLCVDQFGRDLDTLGCAGFAASGIGRFRHAATPSAVGIGDGTVFPAQGPRPAFSLRRAPQGIRAAKAIPNVLRRQASNETRLHAPFSNSSRREAACSSIPDPRPRVSTARRIRVRTRTVIPRDHARGHFGRRT